MVQEELYESCLPILTDKDLEEEDQVEKLEELLRSSTSLSGQSLDNAVLDVLWRFRGANRSNNHNASSPPVRHTVIRRQSPAPWQMARSVTPSISMNNGNGNASPTLTPSIPPGFAGPPGFTRTRSSVGSPFTSPRPSPRLAFAQPIPHSPSLNAYEFSEPGISTPDIYGDYGSDTVDWLVNDDARSTTSSIGGLSAAAAEYLPQPDMSPYDILRSVLGDKKTNEEIEEALEGNNYDLGATIAQLSQNDNGGVVEQSISSSQEKGSVLVGKSLAVEQPIPVMPMHTGGRSAVVCKYWLSTGQCLRADCRFGHDLTNHLCKYVYPYTIQTWRRLRLILLQILASWQLPRRRWMPILARPIITSIKRQSPRRKPILHSLTTSNFPPPRQLRCLPSSDSQRHRDPKPKQFAIPSKTQHII